MNLPVQVRAVEHLRKDSAKSDLWASDNDCPVASPGSVTVVSMAFN